MSSRKSLIVEADRLFSLHIRNRGAKHGHNDCYTCGVYKPVGELQCGHFRHRRFLKTRWHPVNCWPQCNTCNVEKGGNLAVYEAKLVAMFSQDVIDQLYQLSYSDHKVLDDEIRAVVKMYKNG